MSNLTLISGASGDIGQACAHVLAERGDRVLVHAHKNIEAANELSCAIRENGGWAEPCRADLTCADEVNALYESIEERWGACDILVNNAGMGAFSLFQDIEECDWNEVVDANLKSAYLLTRAALPGMIARKKGCIVNIASMWGQVGASCEVHYSAAKGGLISMTKALAKEVGPSGIRINAVAPGIIDTKMIRDTDDAARSELIRQTPLGRIGQPLDVALAVRFLTGQGASFITGQVLGVNGGFIV